MPQAPAPTPDPTDWVGTIEMANELGIAAQTLREWVTRRRVRARKVGKNWEISRGDCVRFKASIPPKRERGSRSVPPASEPRSVAPRTTTGSTTPRMAWLAARVDRLQGCVERWEEEDPPPAYAPALVELRHMRKAYDEEQAKIDASKTVDDLPLPDQLERLRSAVRAWPEQMISVVLLDLFRRYGTHSPVRVMMQRDGETAELAPDGTWGQVTG